MLLSHVLTLMALAQTADQTVVLSDGQTLTGRAAWRDDGALLLVLGDDATLVLPAEAVASVMRADSGPVVEPASASRERLDDPVRSRYFYSPSAFTLGTDRAYVAQRGFALTTVSGGFSDFLDLEAGTILPLLFVPDAKVGLLGGKVAVRVQDRLRVAAGAQALFALEEIAGFTFGSVTYGTTDAHGTLSGGSITDFRGREVLAWVATVATSHRLGPSSAFMSEMWMLRLPSGNGPWGGPFFAVPSGGFRLFGRQWAVDLALVPVITGSREVPLLPLPWVSFAWSWTQKEE